MRTCATCLVSWLRTDTCWCCGNPHPPAHSHPSIFYPYNGSTVQASNGDGPPTTIRYATLTTETQ